MNRNALPIEFQGRIVHPALHFENDWASAGIIRPGQGASLEYFCITSERRLYPLVAIEGALISKPDRYPNLANRWSEDDLQRFISETNSASIAEMSQLLREQINLFLELHSPELTSLVAVWIIGTYVHPIFTTYPRLHITGEKGSGKSKLQEIISAAAFNGILRLSPTPATLFRLAEMWKPAMCLDEIEALFDEDKKEILAIINAGYKRGSAVDRVEGGQEQRRIVSYHVYTPLTLSGIRELNATTQDRTIQIIMQRAHDNGRLNARIDNADSVWTQLRALGYRFALTRFRDVRRTYQHLEAPTWLRARARELWFPLLALAHLIDSESNMDFSRDILRLARLHTEDVSDLGSEAETLIYILEDRIGEATMLEIYPHEICASLQEALNEDRVAPRRVAGMLRRLGCVFIRRGRLPGRAGTGSVYRILKAQLRDLRLRYALLPIATLQQGENATS